MRISTDRTGDGSGLEGVTGAAGALGQVAVAALVQTLPAVIYVAEPGPQGNWLYVSPQIEPILGFTPEEWYTHPKPFATFVHPDDLPRLLELEERLVAAPPGELFDEEYRIATKDGREVWLHGRGAVIRGAGRGITPARADGASRRPSGASYRTCRMRPARR